MKFPIKRLSFSVHDYVEQQLQSEDEGQGRKRCFECRYWDENSHPPVGPRESAGFLQAPSAIRRLCADACE